MLDGLHNTLRRASRTYNRAPEVNLAIHDVHTAGHVHDRARFGGGGLTPITHAHYAERLSGARGGQGAQDGVRQRRDRRSESRRNDSAAAHRGNRARADERDCGRPKRVRQGSGGQPSGGPAWQRRVGAAGGTGLA